ncbi:MAG TPA: ATP-binding cassette domain-containing protein [Candidatus Limiplasma sp.]|nr:ATP-binding cassette domain-containing protein [Candidatus Limiplasma sp.]HRX09656.1 ATP-binding cassette domain-containing protein [Candidatus Limiplasma sp.]
MQNIIVDHISKAYQGKPVLENLSLEFPARRITCIMAPSGYGKTVLLRILLGLETADSGTIRGMDGMRISAVFQENRLCENLSALANVMLVSPTLLKADALTALTRVGLADNADQTVKTLSGGMRRRVALVRALMAEQDVLLMDEPFKGLDLETKQQVMTVTLDECRNKTVIMTTHDPAEAEHMASGGILRLG